MPMFAMAEPETSLTAVLPSTVIHGLLIAAAIAIPRSAVVDPPTDHQVTILDWPTQPTTSHTPFSGGGILVSAPTISEAPPIDLPEFPGIPRISDHPRPDPRSMVDHQGEVGWPGGGELPGSAAVLSESAVDDPPSLLTSGSLRYPAVLEQAGITGSVTLSFVIDLEGRVEPDGIEVLSASHPGFIPAATEAIRSSRFTPAHQHGQLVRVRVRQTVSFRK